MRRHIVGVLAVAMCLFGDQPGRLTMADEPAKPVVQRESPDPFQTAPGSAAPKEPEQPEVARSSTGQPVPVIAVLEMRDIYDRSRGYQAEFKLLRLKSAEPSPEVQKVEAELKTLEASLHDLDSHPVGHLGWQLNLNNLSIQSEVPIDEVLEKLQDTASPTVQLLLKKYALKKSELQGLHELAKLERKAQQEQLQAKYLHRIRAIVKKIVLANQITHVINMHDSLQNTEGLQATLESPIVYTNPAFNITSIVLAKLNEDADIEPIKDHQKREHPITGRPGPQIAIPAEPAKK